MLEDEAITDRIILENIVPFNDFFFYSCFYTMLFSAVKSFHRNVYPYMINMISFYSLYSDEQRLGLYVEADIIEELISYSRKLGIKTESKIYVSNIEKDIIAALSKGRPVILSVNCYYESLRPEFYLKKNWRHCLLVYGYDMKERCCYIIEHEHIDSPVYQKCTIQIDELSRAYEGYLEVFQSPGEGTFHELSFTDYEPKTLKYWREQFVANHSNHLLIIRNSLEQINELKLLFYQKVVLSEASSVSKIYIEDMINGCINTINFKTSQIKLIEYLYGPNSKLLGQIREIEETWKSIRVSLYKLLCSRRNREAIKRNILEKLQGLYFAETEYLETIIMMGA